MSAIPEPVQLANIYFIPLYKSTRWEILEGNKFKFTTQLKGSTLLYSLKFETAEKAHEYACKIIAKTSTRLCRPFIDQVAKNPYLKNGCNASISFPFSSEKYQKRFTTQCAILKIFEQMGFKAQVGDLRTTYFYMSEENRDIAAKKIKDLIAKIDDIFLAIEESAVENETATGFEIEKSCLESEDVIFNSVPSPFPYSTSGHSEKKDAID
jgi:hypothetical protein